MWLLAAILIGGFIGVKVMENQRETKSVSEKPTNCESSENIQEQEPPREVRFALEDIYTDDAVVQVAERCKKGDVSAMRQMAAVLRSRCTPQLIELMDRYEADPIRDNEIEIQNHIKKYFDEEGNAKGYMMWLVRAALYGDKEISAQLEQWPFYKRFAYIPCDIMTGKSNHDFHFLFSSFLYQIGFIDIPSGYEECSLRYNADEKYYDLRYVSRFYPPDEDGFGAEWEYDSIYFDEFFCRLPGKPKSEKS